MQRVEQGGSLNEDELVIPAAWARVVHPRRGGVAGPAVKPKPGELSAPAGSSPQAAAAHALGVMDGWNDKLFTFVDAWFLDRGLGFAAAATVELASRRTSVQVNPVNGALLRMRRFLASANEADYAEAVHALAAHRGDERTRLATAYLVPTESAWADEACSAFRRTPSSHFESRLVMCVLSTPEQFALLRSNRPQIGWQTGLGEFATLAEGLGAAALPILSGALDPNHRLDAETRRAGLSVIAALPGDEAFEALVTHLDQTNVRAAVMEAMNRYPVRALRLLAKAAGDRPGDTASAANAVIAHRLLAGHIKAHPELVAAPPSGLSLQAADLVSKLAAEPLGRPEAADEELPELLVAPPWTRKHEKRAEPRVVAGLEPPALCRIAWAPGEREAWARAGGFPWREDDGWERRAQQAAISGFPRVWDAGIFFTHAPEHLAVPLLAQWRPDFRYWDLLATLGPIVARFGEAALPAAAAAIFAASPSNAGKLLQPLVDPSLARLAADWYTRLKLGRAPAAAWLTRHAEAAALLLVPDAVGEPGERRARAGTALRFLAPLTDVSRIARDAYGPEAAAAVDEVLSFDPLELYPRRMPAFPPWVEQAAAGLPQILLPGRERALPARSVRQVISMLMISTPDQLYAGLATVKECADPQSLADFGWALFEAWQDVELPAKDSWVFAALAAFGDDDTARRLAPLVRAWPGEGGHQRAVVALEVFAAIGTDAALMQLHRISQKVKFKALKSRAQEKIEEIARGLELTPDQLGDRLVPDFGLDGEGTMLLDYGPRRFRVGFDEQLRPFVLDEAGAWRKALPPPNSKDDAELAAAARKHFSGLKKDVRGVAADVIRRLESALVSGRGWQAPEFRELLLEHPLVWHITRRLVWLASGPQDGEQGGGLDGGQGATAFRLAEDRTLATVDDEAYELPGDAVVRLAHPLQLGAQLAAWTELFADYEILQPFPQLGRPVYALTEEERGERRLTRFEGLSVPVGKLLGLAAYQGWERGTVIDGGVQGTVARKVGEDAYLILELEPGIVMGMPDALGEKQLLREVRLGEDPDAYFRTDRTERTDGPVLDSLDEVVVSELLNDLTRLAS